MIKFNKSTKISSLIMLFVIFYVAAELIWPKITLAGEYIESKLTASDASTGDLFGIGIAIQGNTTVVGAIGDDSHTGSAYVFQFDGTNWIEKAKLTASDASAGDRFGRFVGISGYTIVVGAYYDDSQKGSVYVFRFDGLNWFEEAKLTASDGVAGDRFGGFGMIDGDTLVAAASQDDNFTGSVYVFRFDGLNWNEETKLTASDGTAGDNFGSVAVSGNTVLVGAWGDDSRTGAAYVFQFDGTSWNEQAKLTASDGAPGDVFGATSVAINKDADIVLIGAGEDDSETGSAYIFKFDGTSWNEQAKINASDGAAGDYFGHAVSINGNTIVTGAFDDGFTGSAYVFQFDGVSWIEEAKLTASDGAAGDYFSHGVGISGNTIVVGAAHDDDAGSSSGAAYVFSPDIEVDIDIKPGSYPNSINLKSKGKVPVAILTTDDFDADDVDPDTCVFAGASPVHWNMEDVDHDGDHDMVMHCKTQELDLTKGSTEATLEGATYDGMQIIGTDSVNIVPKGNGYGKKSKNKKKK